MRNMLGLFTLVLSLSLLSGCQEAQSLEDKGAEVALVKVIEVPKLTPENSEIFLARIDAGTRAHLSFQLSGEIAQIPVKMGQVVEKGELLASLDPIDFQLALDAKSAEYDLRKAQFERAKRLQKTNLISKDAYDQADSALKTSHAELNQAQKDLRNTRLSAPFNGVVSATMSKPFEVVAARQGILNLIDNQYLEVIFSIPVQYTRQQNIEAIKASPLSVIMDAHPGIRISASLKEISTEPNYQTNTYSAKVTIERPEQLNLLPGMTGIVVVEDRASSHQFKVPDSAWINQSLMVWKVNPHNSSVSQTKIILDNDGRVVAGLTQGDQVVVAGLESLYEGQMVKIWKREGGI
ncbi:efflux RND transporter periplasmic adaptor subunit [Alginatibacterium sediminis]|uniref:Efflux RND transporter periplasmic adaptor subunit n=1 Tax=Alginatibacterium sediminis TaxID=2164068 RepID=A0A420E8L2_9ALTE|nr:efflux RND transporter periplasmic adaptor subunit [Alginatibacterium sediminis]RKF15765.1 efflux RND transporter periplasmic adaptor subunit [Alginatibacterium sediminis]